MTKKPKKSNSRAAAPAKPKKRAPTKPAKKRPASAEDREALISSLDEMMAEIARLDAADVDTHDLRNKFQAVRLNVSLFLEGE